jgi:hypothetical protein
LPSGDRVEIPEASPTPPIGGAVVQTAGDYGDYVVVPFRHIGRGAARIVNLSLYIDQ